MSIILYYMSIISYYIILYHIILYYSYCIEYHIVLFFNTSLITTAFDWLIGYLSVIWYSNHYGSALL